jgi:hypothetical protein
MNSLPSLAVEAAWRAHVNNRPSSNRWTLAGTPIPVRQKAVKQNSQTFERVFWQNGQWVVERAGQSSNILPIENYVSTFNAEWLAQRQNCKDTREWGNIFATRWSGVIREDVQFLARIITSQQIPQPPPAPRPPPPASSSSLIPIRTSSSSHAVSSASAHNPPLQNPLSSPINPTSASLNVSFPEAEKEQEELYNDKRRFELLENHQKVRDGMKGKMADQETHLERLSQQALYLFENGRPAIPWTVGMPENKMAEADYLLLTEAQHLQSIKRGILDKPVVVRDKEFRARRPGLTRDEFFHRLRMNKGKRVPVQDLALKITELSVRDVDVVETVENWQNSTATFSNTNPPINLLNISDKTACVTPLGISKEYRLLNEACMYSFGYHINELHLENTAADFSDCIQFRIIAQRGAVSGFHIDNCGVVTWVTLEPLSDNAGSDKDCIKYWFIIPLHLLSQEEKDQALKDFAKYGKDWQPQLKHKLPSISLMTGDTLIMPPGTIHAAATLTDCFFVGGMCMHPRSLRKTLYVWQYLSRHQDCTNESQPAQARAVLDYLNNSVHENPSRFGYVNGQLRDFDRLCDEISGRTSLKCDCKTGCMGRCSCSIVGQRCGPKCHQGVDCQNPCGSHKSYSSARA